MAFGPRFNLVVGSNAQGKTNVLEALYVAATLGSFRTRHSPDMVRRGAESAMVEASFVRRDSPCTVRVALSGQGRRAWFNGKALRQVDDYLGSLAVVLFTPDDLQLLKGGPLGRRQFLDHLIVQADPQYAASLRQYQRALKQRNALLFRGQAASFDDPGLMAYTRQMTDTALLVCRARQQAVAAMEPLAGPLVQDISGGTDRVSLRFSPGLPLTAELLKPEARDDARQAVMAAYRESFPRDRARGCTTVGPQRDDVEVFLDDAPLCDHGSQGQHRSVVLALKSATVTILTRVFGAPPLLLLDDLSSELDQKRRARLFSRLLNEGGQVFLTGTEEVLYDLLPAGDRRGFTIDAGEVRVRS